MEEQKYRNALPVGFQLNEYQIESVLGKSGGFGITYLATDTNLHQQVAIKEYLPSDFAVREGKSTVCALSTSDEDSFQWGLKRFIEEARTLARFNHPNIVKVLRFFEGNGTAYMVMEYQEGQSLTEYLKDHVISEEELLQIVLPLLDGLEEIHRTGFLHRDIKPTNIYMRYDGMPVLLDFGSARIAIGQRSSSVTSIVSPGYAPLEQYNTEVNDQGPWTDIYALGGVIYFSVFGEPPPAATRRIVKDPLVPASKLGHGKFRRNILEAIDWALQPNKDDRPQNVEEWREKLLEPPLTQRINPVENLPKSQRWIFGLAGMAFILLFAATLGILFYQGYDLAKERDARITVERQLASANEKLKQMEKLQKTVETQEAALDHIGEFDLELAKGEFSYEMACIKKNLKKKYYDVVGVQENDVLWMRDLPGKSQNDVEQIPRNQQCVLYLNHLHSFTKFSPPWVLVEYNGKQGWVYSQFLRRNEDCPLEQ